MLIMYCSERDEEDAERQSVNLGHVGAGGNSASVTSRTTYKEVGPPRRKG